MWAERFPGVFCSMDSGHMFVVTIHSLLLVGGGNSNIFIFTPKIGKIPILIDIFSNGLVETTNYV